MKVLLIILSILASCPAYALTCKNDYGGATSCAANSTAAGDCQTLGFSKDNTEGCAHYLYCPFDTSYKRCASMKPKSCAELGFTQENKAYWCNWLISCDEDPTYTACIAENSSIMPKSCAEMGFTQEDKSSWCGKLIHCDANTTYTACIAEKGIDCTGYTYSTCPSTADSCTACGSGENVKYKITACKNGYTFSGSSCTPTVCSSMYSLSSCPKGAYCSSCLSGSTLKYSISGCSTNYVMNNGSCYDCQGNYNNWAKKVTMANNTFKKCFDTTSYGVSCTPKCRKSCDDTISPGDPLSGACFRVPTAPQQGTEKTCSEILQAIKDDVAAHNAIRCPNAFKVLDNISVPVQCQRTIRCGSISSE